MNQPSPFPTFVDLKALAGEIGDDPKFRRLRSAVDRAARAQSCEADLAQAASCCQVLDEILKSGPDPSSPSRRTIEASLLMYAVVLYERATNAAGKRRERGSIGIRERLSSELRVDHDALVQVRQRAAAHVYMNEETDGIEWHRGFLLGIEEPNGSFRPMHASQRIEFHLLTFKRFRRVVPVAQSLIKERFHELADQLADVINEHPLPAQTFHNHRIDPIDLFGSAEAVRIALEGREDGGASFSSEPPS